MTTTSPAPKTPAPAAQPAAPQAMRGEPLALQLERLRLTQDMLLKQANYQSERIAILGAQAADHRARIAALSKEPPGPRRDEMMADAEREARLLTNQSKALLDETQSLLLMLHGPGPAAGAQAVPGQPAAPPQVTPKWKRGEFWTLLFQVTDALSKARDYLDSQGEVAKVERARVGDIAMRALHKAVNLLHRASAQSPRVSMGADLYDELAELLGDALRLIEPFPWHLGGIEGGGEALDWLRSLVHEVPQQVFAAEPEGTPSLEVRTIDLAAKIIAEMEAAGSKETPNAKLGLFHLKSGEYYSAKRTFDATTPPDPSLYEMRKLRIMIKQLDDAKAQAAAAPAP